MQREIGSDFWIEPKQLELESRDIFLGDYNINGKDCVLLSSGRQAECMVLETIEERVSNIRKVALIPPYTCLSVIEPFIKKGYQIHTYDIDEKLDTTNEMLSERIEKYKPQVVLFHRYFGFDTFASCSNVIRSARKNGIVFVEDKTHSLYSRQEEIPVDYIIGSFRKWHGIPDGGFAVCTDGVFNNKPKENDCRIEQLKLDASQLKYKYMVCYEGEKSLFREKYQLAEEYLENQIEYHEMSPSSKKLQANLDVNGLKKKRRENYNFLYEQIRNIEEIKILMPKCNQDDTPLYFAMLVENRTELQEKLRQKDIYAPIIWPQEFLQVCICKEAQKIYKNVLCLPVDQRYGLDDMQRICECIRR